MAVIKTSGGKESILHMYNDTQTHGANRPEQTQALLLEVDECYDV